MITIRFKLEQNGMHDFQAVQCHNHKVVAEVTLHIGEKQKLIQTKHLWDILANQNA